MIQNDLKTGSASKKCIQNKKLDTLFWEKKNTNGVEYGDLSTRGEYFQVTKNSPLLNAYSTGYSSLKSTKVIWLMDTPAIAKK